MACETARSLFSPKGDFFAYATSDGCLKIWDTSSNVLKQEYTPSSHLSSACSSLAWAPCQQNAPMRGKRAKTSDNSCSAADLNLIAMGTLSGEVILYSVTNGDLHAKLTGGHTAVVTGMSWFMEEDSIFTCSDDQYIARWCVSEGSLTTKWRGSNQSIHAIAVVDTKNLLSAGTVIVWWDLKKKIPIKKFIGHATEVLSMLPVVLEDNSVKSLYFLSVAAGDRVINMWQLTDEPGTECAIGYMTSPDEPMVLGVSEINSKTQPICVSCVTKNGLLSIYRHQLNGRIRKPISPRATVQIANMASKSANKSQRIPVLAARLTESITDLMVAYGHYIRPVFERMEFDGFRGETFLIRDNLNSAVATLEGICQIRQPERPADAKNLAPGYMTVAKPTESATRRRKRKDDDSLSQLPMEERLSAMYLGQTSDGKAPDSDSLVHLLLQGLQSKDNKLLNTVFKCTDDTLIRNTVKRLPLNSIQLLLPVLHERLTKKEQGTKSCLRWLKGVLSVHLSYLMSLQDIDEYIGPVSQLIEAREETFSKMSHFMGFMGILLAQADCKSEDVLNISTSTLAVCNEGSSSEDELEENNKMDYSEIQEDHSESGSDSEHDEESQLSSQNEEADNV